MNTESKFSDDVTQIAAVMLREGKNRETITYLTSQETLSPRAQDYLCDAYFQSREWESAYGVLRKLMDSGANTPSNQKLESKILANWGRYKEALARIEAFIAGHGDDVEAIVIAKVCSHNLGNDKSAQQYGQRAIQLKDRATTLGHKSVPMRPNKTGRPVISFSVWGTNKIYLLGAAINVELSKKYFPEWVVRIYASSLVDKRILAMYQKLGAEVLLADKEFPGIPTYFWRFLIVDDPATRHFLCRDADCRVGPQEAKMVAEWISSKKRFHVARDHVLHDDLILAGMWGGVGTADLKMQELISTYFNGKPTNKYGHDQIFLGKMVWPLIKQSVFVHDRHYWTAGVKSHSHNLDFHFGEAHTNEAVVIKEATDLGLI